MIAEICLKKQDNPSRCDRAAICRFRPIMTRHILAAAGPPPTRQPLGWNIYLLLPPPFTSPMISSQRGDIEKQTLHTYSSIVSRSRVKMWCRSHLRWRHSDVRSEKSNYRLAFLSFFTIYQQLVGYATSLTGQILVETVLDVC